jgi:tetratricopeptide (TPR) repeat protein
MNFAKTLAAGLCIAALGGCAATPPLGAAAPAPAGAAPRSAPDVPAGEYGEALKLMKANQTRQAEAALLALAQAHPQASGPQTNLGILYARSNRKAEAGAAFALAVAANPANAVAHTWLGVLAREAGNYAQAERSYQAALAADPAHADAQLNLAILYDLYLKRPADALAAYRKYEDLTGGKDFRASVWISEIEASAGMPAPAPVPDLRPAAKQSAGETQS